MPLSVVDLYRDILPKTNCGDCNFPTCMAFASMVVSEKLPIGNCPHLEPDIITKCQQELDEQYAAGKWLKRDMAQDALEYAKSRAASMALEDLPDRIGGRLIKAGDNPVFELPYFDTHVIITGDKITNAAGSDLTRWEQVFIYNHMAQGGASLPSGHWKGFVEFPNTVSKIKSMVDNVERPLNERFRGKPEELLSEGVRIGGIDRTDQFQSADLAVFFMPFPRVPVMLMFWDENQEDAFDTEVKLMFDETVTEHLDIESIMFLSERLKELLCGDG